jgi:hypothetical protein
VTINDIKDEKSSTNTISSSVIYFVLIIISQLFINISNLISKCGGNIQDNLSSAFIFTFLPWFLIFGVVLILLNLYPSMKLVFSNIIGYFYISYSSNKILNELMINKDIHDKLQNDASLATEEEKKKMETTADTIIKLFGNTSLLINEIVPSNFMKYWNILTPLFKPKFKEDVNKEELEKMKNQLFELIVTKDNIGELCWYIYIGLLVVAITQMKISIASCNKNTKQMTQNYQKYIEEQDELNKQEQIQTNQIYTIGKE